MSTGNIRRAQLVSPFGVGALSVLVNGTSVITCGLDHWYDTPTDSQLELSEYTENDWRLEARLKVSGFRLPPDYRPIRGGQDPRNLKLTVPVLRFPRWHFCIYCKRLKLSTLTMQQHEQCPDNDHAGKPSRPRMSQVPFVAICGAGHLDDFPFQKWVHRSLQPRCDGVLRLISRGGGGLEGQVVKCDGCNAERSLQGITASRPANDGTEHTTLTDHLSADDATYECPGARPWLGEMSSVCANPIRGALRAAGNVYFPKIESSIYLPRREGAVSGELHELMRRVDVGPFMKLLHEIYGPDASAQELRQRFAPEVFQDFDDEELVAGYQDLTAGNDDGPDTDTQFEGEDLTAANEWRHPEFEQIRGTPRDHFLSGNDPGMSADLAPFLDRVRRVDVLRETRALRGFTRVRDSPLKLSEGKALLRRTQLAPNQDWLPAYVVKGEGIFLELSSERLGPWEQRDDVIGRTGHIQNFYDSAAALRGFAPRVIGPRFVLIHTLAHLLINQLVYSCGYSSASLRERLYATTEPGRQMAGLLIYTAAGDSEGTMGGLVRMAHPDRLSEIFTAALDSAQWCSTDPVCMDAGEQGQGPDSCNLAACHGCALVPETSCEEFNRFLDRGLVVGTFSNPSLGYFSAT